MRGKRSRTNAHRDDRAKHRRSRPSSGSAHSGDGDVIGSPGERCPTLRTARRSVAPTRTRSLSPRLVAPRRIAAARLPIQSSCFIALAPALPALAALHRHGQSRHPVGTPSPRLIPDTRSHACGAGAHTRANTNAGLGPEASRVSQFARQQQGARRSRARTCSATKRGLRAARAEPGVVTRPQRRRSRVPANASAGRAVVAEARPDLDVSIEKDETGELGLSKRARLGCRNLTAKREGRGALEARAAS